MFNVQRETVVKEFVADARDFSEQIINKIENMAIEKSLAQPVADAIVWHLNEFAETIGPLYRVAKRNGYGDPNAAKIVNFVNANLQSILDHWPELPTQVSWDAMTLTEIQSPAIMFAESEARRIGNELSLELGDIKHIPGTIRRAIRGLMDIPGDIYLNDFGVKTAGLALEVGQYCLWAVESRGYIIARAEKITVKLAAKAPYGKDVLSQIEELLQMIAEMKNWSEPLRLLEPLIKEGAELLAGYGAWLDRQKRLVPVRR